MSLSSQYLTPCIPPPEGAQGLGALGTYRGVTQTTEWMQGDALGTIVLSDGARRWKQDRLSLETQGPGSIPAGSSDPLHSPGAARSDGRSAGCQPLTGCHRPLGTGARGRGEGCTAGRCPRSLPCPVPGPARRDLRSCGCYGSPALRHLLVLLLGLLQHLEGEAEGRQPGIGFCHRLSLPGL